MAGTARVVVDENLWYDSAIANVAQSVERIHGKDEVVGSIPTVGSNNLYCKDILQIQLKICCPSDAFSQKTGRRLVLTKYKNVTVARSFAV